MDTFFSSFRSRAVVWVGALLIVAAVLLGGASWYYQGHALPGSSVGSIPIGGKNPSEVAAVLDGSLGNQKIEIQTAGGNMSVRPADVGVAVDVPATVTAVFDRPFFPGILERDPITPVIDVDSTRLREFADDLPLPEDAPARDTEVTFDGEAFTVVAGQAGQQVELEPLADALVAAAGSLQDEAVQVPVAHRQPAVPVDQAAQVAAQMNEWLAMPIELIDEDGDTFTPDVATRANWVRFTVQDGELRAQVDQTAAQAWVQEAAAESETAPVTGLRNVDAAGTPVAVSLPAEDGWVATNTSEVAAAIADGAHTAQPVRETLVYGTAPGTWEDRPAAAGSEDLVYRPAVDEKWIDLDLENSTVTAYEGTSVVAGPFYMVPGAPETPTVEGEYNIYLKYDVQDMRGVNADGSPYLTEDVPWVSYFHGGYGFHGAPWRSSFGWNGPGGSHGCINMEVPEAEFIHQWSEMGTKVVSHY